MSSQHHRQHNTLRIAFVVHLYYWDAFQFIIDKLSILPLTIDLYVTTPSEKFAYMAADKIESIYQIANCDIVIAPNVGRNFAPFLVEFRDRLRHYDLMCHIHTKKSLHTESFSQWGRYLIDNIIGSPKLITSIVELFSSEAKYGIMYPKRFDELPDWSQDWLGNYEIAKSWCRLSGMYLDRNLTEFPTGGMFWARPCAINQIFSFNWSYSDFPAEQGQIDGTMHHAVERLIGAVTSVNRFWHSVYDPRKGCFDCLEVPLDLTGFGPS